MLLPAIPPGFFQETHLVAWQAVQEQRFDGGLKVQFHTCTVDVLGRTYRFTGGVKAIYDVTVIDADELVIDLEAHQGKAIGNVRLVDPEGTLTATDLSFDWVEKTGTASNVDAHLGNTNFKAALIDISPNVWRVRAAFLNPSQLHPPLYTVSARDLTLTPGKSGRASGVKLTILGKYTIKLPWAVPFSLDRRVTGLRLPSIVSRQGQGLGVGWASSFALNDTTFISGAYAAFPRSWTGSSFELSRSWIPYEKSQTIVSPRSELAERFTVGHMDDIGSPGPTSPIAALREPRNSLSIGSYWNQTTVARYPSGYISKRAEIAYERSIPTPESMGALAQVRLQNIRENRGKYSTRALFQGTWATLGPKLSPQLYTTAIVDGSFFLNPTGGYGWLRGEGTLYYQPVKTMRVGVALVAGHESGNSLFDFDRLYVKNAMHVRGDLALGHARFAFLAKYDRDRRKWFDHEYAISYAYDAIEPFITWRLSPKVFTVGIRLRPDDFRDALTRREQVRTKPIPPKSNGNGSGG